MLKEKLANKRTATRIKFFQTGLLKLCMFFVLSTLVIDKL